MELTTVRQALDRTAVLLASDVHHGRATKEEVVEGLVTTRAVVHATEFELRSTAAQHTVVTLVLHLAMCGIGFELDLPDVVLNVPQPPLTGATLRGALISHVAGTFPWVSLDPVDHPDVRFVIGATPPRHAADVVVAGTTTHIQVGQTSRVQARSWAGDWPVAPVAAGIAGAAHAVRVASVRTADLLGTDPPAFAGDFTDLDIDTSPITTPSLGHVPVISAGAMTHAGLHVLLRVPNLEANFQPFDDDIYDITNTNRYSLFTASDIEMPKATSLDRWGTDTMCINGVNRRYEGGEAAGNSRLLVGADDIGVRWTAQDDVTDWLGIGATSHLFAEVSVHIPGSPCAGCVHDHEDAAPAVIPTISIVSGWAGLHLANELLKSIDAPPRSNMIWAYPLGLGGRHGHTALSPLPNPRCARSCPISKRAG